MDCYSRCRLDDSSDLGGWFDSRVTSERAGVDGHWIAIGETHESRTGIADLCICSVHAYRCFLGALERATSLSRSGRWFGFSGGRDVLRWSAIVSICLILLIVLILILVGALPTWGYSNSWGYGPGGIIGVI